MLQTVLDRLESQRDASVDRLRAFLSIPSVSTDPTRREAMAQAAAWTAEQLRAAGLEPHIMPTGDGKGRAGHPVVVAKTTDADVENPGAPRVLFYGHYDVQPPDPLEGWDTPPFEPTVRGEGGGAMYARGASDDKGQTLCFLEALRAYREAGVALPGPVTVMVEGEEEIGSIHLPAFIEANRDLLAADIVVISDTSMWETTAGGEGAARVAITYGLRGLVYFDVKLHGPSRDLHSGVYGGTLANPATLLTRTLGRLWDDEHRITIPGFYDRVLEPTDDERARWDELDFDERRWLGSIGVDTPFGEAERTTLERRWSRPACDINGLYGGFAGEGAKTVIPAMAGAKVSFRIPVDMDPHRVADSFEAWLRGQDVGGCRWEITRLGEAWPAAVDPDSPFLRAAAAAVREATGDEPALTREGATIPVGADFKRLLGIDTLFVGFGLNSDALHAPNEHFGLDRFALGQRVHATLLPALATV